VIFVTSSTHDLCLRRREYRDSPFLPLDHAWPDATLAMQFQMEGHVGYEQPTIADYGDLVELTAQQTDGDFLDADFPAGTPRGDLTFS
jgi:hypothetical protein